MKMKPQRFRYSALGFFLLSVLLLPCIEAAPPAPQAALQIELTSAGQAYDRKIFGQFIEHFHRQIYGGIFEPGSPLADARGFRTDVIAALRELNVPVVRWPGGCFVSSYHWLNGVGPTRTPDYDKAWHVEDPNTFGTDEFIAWCRLIGAEPFICTNAGTGTPEEMSDWVEYCNLETMGRFARLRIANGHPEPYRVKYWSIGNENYGSWEMGAKTVDEWGYFVRESAKLMFNVDPSIQLFAAALPDPKWTVPLLERAGEHLSFVSIHGYWDPLWRENNPLDYAACMRLTTAPEKQIRQTIEILKSTGFENRIKIAFDEWNLRGWHHPGQGDRVHGQDVAARDKNDLNATYTMADALFSACFLNSCLRNSQHVVMACMAPVVNARGPLFVHPGGIVKRTTFHVLQLYASLLQPHVLPATLSAPAFDSTDPQVPVVDGIVTANADKTRFTIALVNKHATDAVECDLGLGAIDRTATATFLSGDSPDAFNDIATPDRVVPVTRDISIRGGRVTVPAHTLLIVSLTR